MKTSDFDYELPQELIAQTPAVPRDSARLLVVNRQDDSICHTKFRSLPTFLAPGDLLVINQTRVLPARLHAKKYRSGGKVEILLLRQVDSQEWEVLVGGKRILAGGVLKLEDGLTAQILEDLGGPRRLLRFSHNLDVYLAKYGHVPLPPYIQQPTLDPDQYQTVFSKVPGSAAAPTAGLHFTSELLARLEQSGIQVAKITLHIGLDTFSPVVVEDPRHHQIHTEWCQLSQKTADQVNRTKARGHRVIAIGTTSVRTLETAAKVTSPRDVVSEFEGPTDLYILPGYKFTIVDAMVTNFHLPRSSLLMMVSAFTGRRQILSLYNLAIQKRYRFYSFGDAMLIL